MSGLHVVTSNRLEVLAENLADAVRAPLGSPFASEVILVQSQGMARWAAMELARRFGAWMNGGFPLPNAFLDGLFRSVSGGGGAGTWDPRVLRWRVMARLSEALGRPGFGPVRHYLGAQERQLKSFQLSSRIAETFDGYALFRPEMVAGWEAGETSSEDGWQAELWRMLAAEDGGHRASARRAFFEALRDRPASSLQAVLPERVSVFGVSALPRFHLEALAALAERIEVNLFLLSPCREYWADIVPERVASRKPAELHYATGNRLLSSLGRAGRDFFGLVHGFDVEPVEDYREPGEDTLLHSLQSDILDLREPIPGAAKARFADGDRSLRFHSCHSPLREVEVLRDCLLELFERDPSLAPRDVVVMTPDLESYAPFIEAVFGGPADPGEPRFPFAIADRTARASGPLADAFLRSLELVGSRFAAASVLDLLECDAVRRRFGFSAGDVDRAHDWARETRIRWGVDAESRGRLGLPAFAENTWQAGLDRLLLGYAMPSAGDRLFGGHLPFDGLEGADAAAALGRLAEFTERLFQGCRDLEQSRGLASWARDLGLFFDSLFLPGQEDGNAARMLRLAFSRLAEAETSSRFARPVELEVVRTVLAEELGEAGSGHGLLSGGVTFGGMRTFRGIPFRVVCLIGMNDGSFPRASTALGFDLLARNPMPGDRSRRDEDRYTFLEALLSVRDHLHVSYVGQSLRDGNEIPPSVLVSELLDALDQGYGPAEASGIPSPGESWARERLLTAHRLQAFSPRYFNQSERFFSYSSQNARASRCLLAGAERGGRGPFLRRLPDPPEGLSRLSLRDLSRFFSNPAKYLLSGRLGLFLEDDSAVLEDREPFELAGLERYDLGQRLVSRGLAGADLGAELDLARARGVLPHGSAGSGAFRDLRHGAESFLQELRPYLADEALEPLAFEHSFPSGIRLDIRVEGLRARGLVRYRAATVKPNDRIGLWLDHLALHLASRADVPRESVLVGTDERVALGPVAGAEKLLEGLLSVYREGLCRPVPFFPRSSWAYAEKLWTKGASQVDALRAARTEWEGGYSGRPGERNDPAVALCFGEEAPLGGEFAELAERFFRPFIEAGSEGTRGKADP